MPLMQRSEFLMVVGLCWVLGFMPPSCSMFSCKMISRMCMIAGVGVASRLRRSSNV